MLSSSLAMFLRDSAPLQLGIPDRALREQLYSSLRARAYFHRWKEQSTTSRVAPPPESILNAPFANDYQTATNLSKKQIMSFTRPSVRIPNRDRRALLMASIEKSINITYTIITIYKANSQGLFQRDHVFKEN